MKRTIILAMLFAAISFAQSESGSSLTVEEVFSVETSEELEASLTDGYPMPWLAEILNDETIPEEDRYWLDCRVRALYAENLHLFFDKEGAKVNVEADWIKYGEYYWRENFVVNPVGEYVRGELNPETGLRDESGFIYNRFGERTGNLPLCTKGVILSRDGSNGVACHLSPDVYTTAFDGENNPYHLYFLQNDGSYYMNPENLSNGAYFSLSQSGKYCVLISANSADQVQLFDGDGRLLWNQTAVGTGGVGVSPFVFPNDKYCVFPCATRGSEGFQRYLQVYAIEDGHIVKTIETENTLRTSSSQDGTLLFAGENCISMNTDNTLFSIPANIIRDHGLSNNTQCVNSGTLFTFTYYNPSNVNKTGVIYASTGEIILEEIIERDQCILLSPNGSFAMISDYSSGLRESSPPMSIWNIGGDFE